jgi:hypothetical protein
MKRVLLSLLLIISWIKAEDPEPTAEQIYAQELKEIQEAEKREIQEAEIEESEPEPEPEVEPEVEAGEEPVESEE